MQQLTLRPLNGAELEAIRAAGLCGWHDAQPLDGAWGAATVSVSGNFMQWQPGRVVYQAEVTLNGSPHFSLHWKAPTGRGLHGFRDMPTAFRYVEYHVRSRRFMCRRSAPIVSGHARLFLEQPVGTTPSWSDSAFRQDGTGNGGKDRLLGDSQTYEVLHQVTYDPLLLAILDAVQFDPDALVAANGLREKFTSLQTCEVALVNAQKAYLSSLMEFHAA